MTKCYFNPCCYLNQHGLRSKMIKNVIFQTMATSNNILFGVTVSTSRDPIYETFHHHKNPASEAALLSTAGEKFFKFSIAICINCVRKMLISGHFHGIMELLLNNYFEHWNILSLRKICFSFQRKCNKANTLVTC